MDELSKEHVVSFYNKKLQMHGDSPEALRWTEKGQLLHYECILDIDRDIDGKKILDYGCGKGDFYQFLKNRNISVHYTGFDINEKLIALARLKYPECRFRVFDVESDGLEEDFDFIFLCGVFNLKVQGLDKIIKNTLIKLFEHCRTAVAFNALSSHDPAKDFELHYVSPEAMFEFAVRNLSPFVALRHDRIPCDFTMFVYKENICDK
ncbi:MAG: methyltransferase domain-containing protein [Nitrospirae bacterium]|nr:methyltransferase domain-containing protein [Nitrospirota bacterium]